MNEIDQLPPNTKPFSLQILEDGLLDTYEVMKDSDDFPETIVPIENADANFLFLVGLADRNWKSEEFADKAIKRLQQAGRNNYEVGLDLQCCEVCRWNEVIT